IIYDLTDINAGYLTSFVGVDRQMFNTPGSVEFQVFVDGEKEFDSGRMNSTDPQKFVEVNLGGAKELELVVTDGGNGNGSDHATWGDAKLYFADPGPDLDTSELNELIEEAKAFEEIKYTESTYKALQKEIDRAEKVIDAPTDQNEIDEAIDALQKAIDDLEE